MKISYLVTCHNEKQIGQLLGRLKEFTSYSDEIIVLDDFSDNLETVEVLELYKKEPRFTVIQHSLSNDYGAHKNYGNSLCKGEWILQIDGDELPSIDLLQNIKEVLEANPDIELIFVPRINDFIGVTPEHAKKWGWRLSPCSACDNRPIVNWPDLQGRIYRNIPDRIKWDRRLHEKIVGHLKYTSLPAETDWALYHDKTIEKQVETNLRYNKMFTQQENMGHNVI